ncbi:MAG: hypothetical protein OXG64_08535 [Chloroflexi bacterium]|nr:hypothetical protein [Chloroflexota bacterium]
MTRKNWLLLAVAGHDRTVAAPIDPMRLMKTLFVFREQLGTYLEAPDFYAFEPYRFGPFAREIYPDLDQLEYEGLIEPVANPGRTWPRYRLTVQGAEAAAALESDAGWMGNHLFDVRDWAMSMSFRDLLYSVYKQWPDYATNSIARV